MSISVKLTVFFEEPFWVGVFERTVEEQYQVCRHVFGAEPKDYDVFDFLLKEYDKLRFSIPISSDEHVEKKVSPKKAQKKISKELENIKTGTKAQEAMKLQYETNKTEHKKMSKEIREEMERQIFELRQLKRKEKHKGH
jgi:hypothetical protein